MHVGEIEINVPACPIQTVAEVVYVRARIQLSMSVVSRLGKKVTLIPQHEYVETERDKLHVL